MATDVAATVMLRVDMRHLPLIGGDDVLKDNFVEKEARLESTWREFLTRKVGLKLRGVAADQVLVCSHGFVLKPHKQTYGPVGWCANLNGKIADFVAKYRRSCPMYSVRLLGGNKGGISSSTTITSSAPMRAQAQKNGRAGMTYRVPPPPPPPAPIRPRRGRPHRSASARGGVRGLERVSPTFGGSDLPPVLEREMSSSSVRGAPTASGGGNPLMDSFLQGLFPPGAIRRIPPFGGAQQQQQRGDQVDVDDESSDEEDGDGAGGEMAYDDASDGTARTEEEMELRNDGIEMDFIKAEAVERLSRMENTILLRARKEVQNLRQDRRWFKNVKRAPFCCILVEELLRPRH